MGFSEQPYREHWGFLKNPIGNSRVFWTTIYGSVRFLNNPIGNIGVFWTTLYGTVGFSEQSYRKQWGFSQNNPTDSSAFVWRTIGNSCALVGTALGNSSAFVWTTLENSGVLVRKTTGNRVALVWELSQHSQFFFKPACFVRKRRSDTQRMQTPKI